MQFILFLLFVAMPFIELALLISLGQQIGFWPTIAIVVVTALLGAAVLHSQGVQTLRKISESMASGEPPIQPVFDGFFIAIAGAFMLTPGVITDAVGLLLLVPPVRRAIARWGLGRLMKNANVTVTTYSTAESPSHSEPRHPFPDRSGRPRPGTGPVIDGEFEDLTKK